MFPFLPGTNWIAQIISLILAGEEKYEETKKINLMERVVYSELTLPGNTLCQVNITELIQNKLRNSKLVSPWSI